MKGFPTNFIADHMPPTVRMRRIDNGIVRRSEESSELGNNYCHSVQAVFPNRVQLLERGFIN